MSEKSNTAKLAEQVSDYMRREQQRAALETTSERKFIAEEALRNYVFGKVEALEAALRPVVMALGDHYCGVCGNAEYDDECEQPYSNVSDPETETCSGCRHQYEAYAVGLAALDVEKVGGEG